MLLETLNSRILMEVECSLLRLQVIITSNHYPEQTRAVNMSIP
jgi:hypothetical protein